jgi:two-component system nitrogen regulation sensor histidine kinase NtrY
MVDEFSAFARMPQPVIRAEDVGRVAREALVLQRTARPQIEWVTEMPERGPVAPCDRRLLGQALTNLLQNAADAVAMRAATPPESEEAAHDTPAHIGRIEVRVWQEDDAVLVRVADDGVGLPSQDRGRLTEPYVTHKPKGTGLGLAIVKKIMEEQGGTLLLDDRAPSDAWPGGGAVATLRWPLKGADAAAA